MRPSDRASSAGIGWSILPEPASWTTGESGGSGFVEATRSLVTRLAGVLHALYVEIHDPTGNAFTR